MAAAGRAHPHRPGGKRHSTALVPRPKRNAIPLHEIPAPWTPARVAPRLDLVFGFHGAGQRGITPDQGRQLLRQWINGALAQNHGGNVRPVEAGKFDQINRIGSSPLPPKHIE